MPNPSAGGQMTIEEIEKLLDGTTEGEWEVVSFQSGTVIVQDKNGQAVIHIYATLGKAYETERWANAAFIAASKGIVKFLLERVKKLEVLRSQIATWECCCADGGEPVNCRCRDIIVDVAQCLIEKGS